MAATIIVSSVLFRLFVHIQILYMDILRTTNQTKPGFNIGANDIVLRDIGGRLLTLRRVHNMDSAQSPSRFCAEFIWTLCHSHKVPHGLCPIENTLGTILENTPGTISLKIH
jgi:hypothetical protein